jgi:outer membrane lipoprotein SlyB
MDHDFPRMSDDIFSPGPLRYPMKSGTVRRNQHMLPHSHGEHKRWIVTYNFPCQVNPIKVSQMKSISFLVVLSIFASLSLSGCARNRIIIDRQGVDMAAYDHDLAECRAYANESGGTGAEAAKGAVGGAVIGGAIGAAVGNGGTAEKLGGAGAVVGAVRGARKSRAEKLQIVKNCLSGRGYKVLN